MFAVYACLLRVFAVYACLLGVAFACLLGVRFVLARCRKREQRRYMAARMQTQRMQTLQTLRHAPTRSPGPANFNNGGHQVRQTTGVIRSGQFKQRGSSGRFKQRGSSGRFKQRGRARLNFGRVKLCPGLAGWDAIVSKDVRDARDERGAAETWT